MEVETVWLPFAKDGALVAPTTKRTSQRLFRDHPEGPFSGFDRGRRRRNQPPVLPYLRELRHALESDACRAAHWPHLPLRAGQGCAGLPLFQQGHD